MCIEIINSIPLTLYGQEQKVKVADIPVISASTKKIFTELGCATSDVIIYPMKAKAQSLANMMRALWLERRHAANCEKCLSTAMAVGVLGCMVILAVTISWLPSIGSMGVLKGMTMVCSLLITGAVSVFGHIGFGIYNFCRIEDGQIPKAGTFTKVAAVLGGPLFAIYDNHSSIQNLKRIIAEKTAKIEKKFSLLTHQIEQIDAPKLRSAITATLQEIDHSLKNLNKLSIVPESGRKQLEEMKKPYQLALNELETAVAYYKQPESREAAMWKQRFEALEARCNGAIDKLEAAASEPAMSPQFESAD